MVRNASTAINKGMATDAASIAGLVIVSAYYGSSACFTEQGISEAKGLQDKVIDVTIPVQALVNSGHLFIPGGRAKFNLLGLYVSLVLADHPVSAEACVRLPGPVYG